MTQHTANIIMACKGTIYSDIEDRYLRVKSYLAEYLDIDINLITADFVEQQLIKAAFDYIDSADIPSTFLKLLTVNYSIETNTRLLRAFTYVSVKNALGDYINGFNEKLLKPLLEQV